MRIVHLAKHCANSNGNVHVAVDLACTQAKRGHAVTYASVGGYYEDLLKERGVSVEFLDQGASGLTSVAKTVFGLVRLCQRKRPDVLHAHMMSSAVFGYLASKIAGIPLITTVHNSFDGHSRLMRLGDKAVAVSGAERQLLLSRGFKPGKVITVMNGPNCSPREEWPNATLESKSSLQMPSVVTLCGLHQRKGVHDIIRAFCEVHKEYPEWHLNIVGEGPDQEKLKALAAELGIAQSTHFIGPVRRPQQLLGKSSIFVLASYAEPFGLATAEARQAGCAVIATAVGGTPEVLEQGSAGILVPPGQPERIAAELRRLMSNPEELRDWQKRSKSGADYFSVDRMTNDYESVYRLLANLNGD
jgi:glycosyltransferase involved in cell wall biosynthesis